MLYALGEQEGQPDKENHLLAGLAKKGACFSLAQCHQYFPLSENATSFAFLSFSSRDHSAAKCLRRSSAEDLDAKSFLPTSSRAHLPQPCPLVLVAMLAFHLCCGLLAHIQLKTLLLPTVKPSGNWGKLDS